MITLRELREEDAELMLEWMHDKKTQESFKRNMLDMTLESAKNFCKGSKIPCIISDGISLHYAIADDDDEYLGTISLKNIDLCNKRAEYAIAVRPCAQNKGVAYKATMMILKKAFKDYQLHRVYLTVVEYNNNAIKLYEKCGFVYEGELREHLYRNGKYVNWKLYGILDTDFEEII